MSIGVAVSHRLGRQLAMTLVASLVIILFSHFFLLFSFFLHCLLFKKKEFQYYTYYIYYMYYHGSLFFGKSNLPILRILHILPGVLVFGNSEFAILHILHVLPWVPLFGEVKFGKIKHITHITRGPWFL